MLKRWDKFAAENLSPPPSRRVGARLIESGEIDGELIAGWPWVNMDAWHTRKKRTASVTDRALDLLK